MSPRLLLSLIVALSSNPTNSASELGYSEEGDRQRTWDPCSDNRFDPYVQWPTPPLHCGPNHVSL